MTKLIVDLKTLENISKYHVDGLIVSSERFSSYNDRCFSLEEIKQVNLFCKEHNLTIIVNIDRIIEEDELNLLYQEIDEFLKLDIDYFIYGDFAVLAYFKEKNLLHKLIYDPKTMITNYEEARIHQRYGSLVAVSNELTFDEIKEIVNVGNSLIEVYGYHQMFYSRRKVLSTFSKFQAKDRILDQKLLKIKEEIRNDMYPIFESNYGTFVYTHYRYLFFKELPLLFDQLQMIRINSMFIDEEEILKIIDIYQDLINNNYTNIDELYNQILEVNPNVSGGFLNKKSILLKEGEND